MLLRKKRLDAMKKKNINYCSLAERGIRKAWDKACVYAYAENENYIRLVLFYAGKPFESWSVKEPFNIEKISSTINTAIGYYSESPASARRISKRLARYFIENEAGERLVTYRHGGVLFPKEA